MGSVKVNDLEWPLKGQYAISKVRCGLVMTYIMHNISIPVNGSKFRGWKHDVLEKSAGGCTSYDVIAPWPGQTRSFFCQKLCKGCPIDYAIFQRDPPSGSQAIPEKLMGGCINPHPPARARVKLVTSPSCSHIVQKQLYVDRHREILLLQTKACKHKYQDMGHRYMS